MTEQTDAAEVLSAAESNALCEALDEDGCHGFLNDHVETLAALGRILAAREAAARTEALREAADAILTASIGRANRTDVSAWLRIRARIARSGVES